jgi:hypothetical protein
MNQNFLRALPLAVLAASAASECPGTIPLRGVHQRTSHYPAERFLRVNIDFLTSDFSNPANYGPEVTELQTAVSTSQPIPAVYFNIADPSTVVKVADLKMDIYQPDQSVDSETARPIFIFVHTGNALPPPLNGSPNGTKTDSSAVEVCKRMARRGYVAVSMDYRNGWNPLGTSVEERRGTLLNAIYRAVHDVKQCVRS